MKSHPHIHAPHMSTSWSSTISRIKRNKETHLPGAIGAILCGSLITSVQCSKKAKKGEKTNKQTVYPSVCCNTTQHTIPNEREETSRRPHFFYLPSDVRLFRRCWTRAWWWQHSQMPRRLPSIVTPRANANPGVSHRSLMNEKQHK